MPAKSTVEQIRQRFDREVERFANLETGQVAAMDSPLGLELLTAAAAAATPHAKRLLDIGCGAGNYSLKMLQAIPDLHITMIDLSERMLDRAIVRVSAATSGNVVTKQGDIRKLPLQPESYDIILAGAVFHHLRGDDEWHSVFAKCYKTLRPGGSLWIFDMVEHDHPQIQALMKKRYAEYLVGLKGETYRDQVFGYIEEEDTPRSLNFQVAALQKAGFEQVEILHKNGCFAAFGAIKAQAEKTK